MGEKIVVFEIARDGNYTCKLQDSKHTRYLYSKYRPIRSIEDIGWSYTQSQEYILLGIGLGYELESLIDKGAKHIIIIDKDNTFINFIKDNMLELWEEIKDHITLYIGEEYYSLCKKNIKGKDIVINNHLMQVDPLYYSNVIKYLNDISESSKTVERDTVMVFEHPTIADDCIEAFRNLGYIVNKQHWLPKERLYTEISKKHPKFIFTINPSEIISEIADYLNIIYISWTVDTPAYSLYSEGRKRKKQIYFVYDEVIVYKLRQKGLDNVYYMPVAANVERLDKIDISDKEKMLYNTVVSFLGSSAYENEFNEYIEKHLSVALKREIENKISLQNLSKNFILPYIVDNSIIEDINRETGYLITGDDYLSPYEKLGFLLGRKHSEIEREQIIKFLGELYKVKVYGDESWRNKIYGKSIYMGYAEHFIEMPKIFRCSKVNINLTRSFVETGLPMRVFDVLGSKAFLVTNDKLDIRRYFQDGRHCIIFRDLQDLQDIIEYYLVHEEERQHIINEGYNLVKKHHTYEIRLEKMMGICRKELQQ